MRWRKWVTRRLKYHGNELSKLGNDVYEMNQALEEIPDLGSAYAERLAKLEAHCFDDNPKGKPEPDLEQAPRRCGEDDVPDGRETLWECSFCPTRGARCSLKRPDSQCNRIVRMWFSNPPSSLERAARCGMENHPNQPPAPNVPLMKTFQHDETGRTVECYHSPGPRWFEVAAPEPLRAKYRKRPVVIEAYRATVPEDIETLEGTMHADAGDWIITGLRGERYPCKPDIFEASYEPVGEEQPAHSAPTVSVPTRDQMKAVADFIAPDGGGKVLEGDDAKAVADWLRIGAPRPADARCGICCPAQLGDPYGFCPTPDMAGGDPATCGWGDTAQCWLEWHEQCRKPASAGPRSWDAGVEECKERGLDVRCEWSHLRCQFEASVGRPLAQIDVADWYGAPTPEAALWAALDAQAKRGGGGE